MTITENTIEVGTLKWFYREAIPNNDTHKPPVLFLHGLPSQSYSWTEVMPQLAESGLRAIAPDWIGSGFSDKPDTRRFAYTPEAFIKALSDLIAALNLEKVSLVVQGFLGSVGLQYALRSKEMIERLIILNTPLSTNAKLPWAMKQWALPLVGDMVTQDPLLVDRTLEGGSGFVISDERLSVYRKPFLKTSATGRALLATIKNLKLAESMAELESGLADFSKPTLIIWGSADPWLSSADAEKLATKSNIELIKLEEAKHYPQEHWSGEISQIMVNFLRRQT
ncbi:alpha/beta fold hydrolase [Gloeothece verrucosa]|uniref:Alpha/beta hydrolase fold protein n=1 Tax=Gloeothece verrucosa (strain PCC 7822) TaxID=497965 RepID=E0U968_GLOV7|nr:alpha/beta fold hydrolase [Gloeothece verrucosa]ADN17326.1 alpha/beta hydrolase fold protein [Gloeothece verrucosa PCC 7822]